MKLMNDQVLFGKSTHIKKISAILLMNNQPLKINHEQRQAGKPAIPFLWLFFYRKIPNNCWVWCWGKKKGVSRKTLKPLILLAERTGLEPATSGVTGRHSNQLNYRSV
jgi:hypothetical protein